MNTTKKLTLSAILAAFGVVVLLLGAVIEVMDLSAAAIAGLCVVVAVIEIGSYYPFCIYAVISLLAFLLIPSKMPAFVFVLFCGYYPILKAVFERHHPVVAWVLKFSLFNAALTVMAYLASLLLKSGGDMFTYTLPLFGVANLTFLLYDIAMSKMILLYLVKIKKTYFK